MNATTTELNHKMAALRERAEAAEAELEAVRDDNHSMMLEIEGLRNARDKLQSAMSGKLTHALGKVTISDSSVQMLAVVKREARSVK